MLGDSYRDKLRDARAGLSESRTRLHPCPLVFCNGPTDPCISYDVVQAALLQTAINSMDLAIGSLDGLDRVSFLSTAVTDASGGSLTSLRETLDLGEERAAA